MASKEIYITPAGVRLFGGLEWRVLDAKQSTPAALRTTGKERSSSHAVTAQSVLTETVLVGKKSKEVHRVSGGFFVSAEEGEGPGKKAHSLAAAFALWVREHDKAALYVHTSTGKVAVVIVLNGLPSLDKVVDDETEAYAIVAGYIKEHPAISVFADDMEKFPTTLMDQGLLEGIASAAGKSTLIKPLPLDVVQLSILALVIIGLLLGYQVWSSRKAEEERKTALLRARAADPVPKYLAALSAQQATLGATRGSLVEAFRTASKVPIAVKGWRLNAVDCKFGAPACVATYTRISGTFDGLKRSLASMSLDQAGSMNLNEARMTWQQALEPDVLDVANSPFVLQGFVEGSGSQFQDWLVAGLGLQIQAPTLWPVVPEVPSTFRHPKAVALGRLDVSSIPLPLAEEVIAKAPANVIWSGFTIQVGEAKGDPLAQAKVNITGSFYVQN